MTKIGEGVPSRVSSDCSSQARLALAGAGREGTPSPILVIHRFQALLDVAEAQAKRVSVKSPDVVCDGFRVIFGFQALSAGSWGVVTSWVSGRAVSRDRPRTSRAR